MRTLSKDEIGKVPFKLTYTKQLPKLKVVPERKRVRQLLRSMLQMELEQRQYKEEQIFSQKISWAK